MHYSVHYEPDKNEKYPVSAKPKQGKNGVRVFAVILAIILLASAVHFKKELTAWLIPGNDAITVQATEDLLTNMRDGVPIRAAITVFCEEIIDNGT